MDFRPIGNDDMLVVEATEPLDDFERFGSVYRDHYGYVRAVVRRFGVPVPDCDDAAQEVFVSAYRRLDSLSAHDSVRAWLYSFARFTAFNFNRGEDRRRRKHGALAKEKPVAAAGGSADELVMQGVARRFIDRLDDDKREIFVLSELYDMTSREISDATGLNANTVRSRLRAARKQFRRLAAGLGMGNEIPVSQAVVEAARRGTQREIDAERSHVERRWAAFLPLVGLSALEVPGASAAEGSALAAGELGGGLSGDLGREVAAVSGAMVGHAGSSGGMASAVWASAAAVLLGWGIWHGAPNLKPSSVQEPASVDGVALRGVQDSVEQSLGPLPQLASRPSDAGPEPRLVQATGNKSPSSLAQHAARPSRGPAGRAVRVDRLRAETRVIQTARGLLRKGQATAALNKVAEYRQRFPKGQHAASALQIEARAYCLSGQRAKANAVLAAAGHQVSERTRLALLGGCR